MLLASHVVILLHCLFLLASLKPLPILMHLSPRIAISIAAMSLLFVQTRSCRIHESNQSGGQKQKIRHVGRPRRYDQKGPKAQTGSPSSEHDHVYAPGVPSTAVSTRRCDRTWNAPSVLDAEGCDSVVPHIALHERDKSFGIGIMQCMGTLRTDDK